MKQGTPLTTVRILAVGFAVALGCTVGLGALAIWQGQQMGQAADTITSEALPINQAAHDLLLQLINEETGARAYVATGQSLFLQPYTAGRARAAADLAVLAAHSAGHAGLRRLIATRVLPQIGRIDAYFGQLIALVRQGHRAAALARLGAGKQQMDAFRATMDAAVAQTEDTVRTAGAHSGTALTHLIGAVLVGSTGAGVLILIIGLRLVRSVALRLQAEQSLAHLRRQHTLILSSAGEGIYGLDRQGRTTFVNPAAAAMCGYSVEEVVGRPMHALLHHTRADGTPYPQDDCPIHGTLRDGRPRTVTDELFWHRDGHGVPVEYTSTPIREDGMVVGAVVTVRDVSTRRAAEAALREREARFRALTEQASDLVSIVDAAGAITYASPSYQAVLGYAPADLQGRSTFALLHPDDRASAQRAFRGRMQDDGSPRPVELRVRHADGSWRTLDVIGNNRLTDPAVEGVILTGRDITERAQATEALRHQALHDALTGLPNRVLLQDRVQQAVQAAQREHSGVALLLLDLDRFKEVNDTFGHHAGDVLLQQVAQRLREALRATDTVARLGGDEFAILLTAVDRAGALAAAGKVRAALEEPVLVGEQAVHVEGSLGVALGPEHGEDTATLLRHADVAMYLAKDRGEDCTIYAPEQDTYTPDRLALIAELRAAIAGGALQLHYQPKVDLATRQVLGVEALVRWRHPERGLVRPDQFIPLAEHTGLIAPLTLWVLEEALRQGQEWGQHGYDLGVAVNLSARNLQDPRLPEIVAGLLGRYAVPPPRLTLEITESALMADPLRAQTILARLAEVGVRLSIDDFGTGYSSLGYLKQLPVDEVKIDQSFVRGMGVTGVKDAAIVRSVIDLGHNLGLSVVAEGVEDQAVWERLRAARCDVAQGYYLSRPVPAADLERWLGLQQEPGDAP